MRIGIPALAGLSVLHGLVPPHPGPLVAIDALNADLGITLALGVLIAIPTVIIAGPAVLAGTRPGGWTSPPPTGMIPRAAARRGRWDSVPAFGATLGHRSCCPSS